MKKQSPDKIRVLEGRFFSSIKRGTGEAILLMKRYPNIDFDKFILRACRQSFADDPQCEDREPYLYEIIKLSKGREKLEAQLIQSLRRARKGTWDTDQLIELAELFASNGNRNAREALYERHSKFLTDRSYEYDNRIAGALIYLDELKGLKFAAEIEGKRLLSDPEASVDDRFLSFFNRLKPDINVRKELSKEAKVNKYVKRYLGAVDDYLKSVKKYRRPHHTYDSIRRLIESDARVPISIGKYISKGVLKKLEMDYINESDKNRIIKYLRVFAWADYKLDVETLIRYADSDDVKIRRAAVGVLEKTKDERIRRLIDQNHKNRRKLIDYLPLLDKNFRETDHATLLRLLRGIKKSDDFHWASRDIINTYGENPSKRSRRVLMEIYNRINCSVCRTGLLRYLIDSDVLPSKILKEAMYDCDEDARDLMREYAKRSGC